MRYPAQKRLFHRAHAVATAALHGMSLVVEAGERLAIFGENGAGKSTLLRLAAGILLPSQGRVLVRGEDVATTNVRRSVGYVFAEERSFYFRLSGIENLRFFAALEDLFGKAADDEARRLLDAVGLGAAGSRSVAEYSTGMRQRLALARGLLGSPDILLLDEPTRSLDPAGMDALHALLSSSLLARHTMLLATNRFEDAVSLCDRVAVLARGKIMATQVISNTASVEKLSSFVRSGFSGNPLAGST